MNREEFCKILRVCRQQSGYKIKEMCFKLNTMPTDIYRLEGGTNNFLLNRIMDYLSTVGYVICLQDVKSNKLMLVNYDMVVEWLIHARTGKYSQRALAEQIGRSYVTIANVERNKTNMSIDIFLKIVDVLGYTVTIEKKQ